MNTFSTPCFPDLLTFELDELDRMASTQLTSIVCTARTSQGLIEKNLVEGNLIMSHSRRGLQEVNLRSLLRRFDCNSKDRGPISL